MNFALAGLLVWFAAVDLPVGTELQYEGTLNQQAKSGAAEVKTISLYVVAIAATDGSSQLAYHVDERGGGSWGWPERFGVLMPAEAAPSKSRPIRVLYTHEGQQYPISIRSPFFEYGEKLAPQTSWTDGRSEYVVTRKRKVKDRDCCQVEVTSNLGRIQTLVVETETGILVSLEERVIIGRGDEFQLKLELKSQKLLSSEEIARNRKPLDSLLEIQSELNRTGDQKMIELTVEQLSGLQKRLPKIEKEAEETSWSRVVAMVTRDLQQQKKRLDGIAGLEKKLIGRPAPSWSFKLVDGTSISDAEVKNQVVVLHFWQYRNEPLSEPYGQVGYLDFLNGKRKKLGVRIIGVNVDERFANPSQKGAALRSMKGFLDFMKVGYEMAMDDGTTLAEFGDPRALGAPLPLWIVIGHDGKVIHSHTGFYDIKPDDGLKQLDEAVVEALRRQKGK